MPVLNVQGHSYQAVAFAAYKKANSSVSLRECTSLVLVTEELLSKYDWELICGSSDFERTKKEQIRQYATIIWKEAAQRGLLPFFVWWAARRALWMIVMWLVEYWIENSGSW
jgi:hypothetical protein